MKFSFTLSVVSLALFGYSTVSQVASRAKNEKINFGRDVMPILGQRCFKCHGPDAAQVAAGLRLDSEEGSKKAIVPGSPETSLLVKRVSEHEAEMRMPPADSGVKPLTASEISTLRQWIAEGANYEKHWSFVPPTMPQLPVVQNRTWAKNPIDFFVLSKLESAGLVPEEEADRDTLALRAALTLTGLPPTQTELESFRNDPKPGAYERYVDRLIAKPSYGEHQARYWLDAVRYGDTHGLQLDNERGVFPYRDWVVRAFNQDLPYSDFIEWQLAGDLLPHPTTEQLIASGYVRMNLTSAEGGAIEEEFLARNTFDRVDTTSTVILGLTIACAKCHDHKYDPIKQKDYYGLYAFFNSTADKPLDNNESFPEPVMRAPTPDQEVRLRALDAKISELVNSVSLEEAVNTLVHSTPALPRAYDWKISQVSSHKTFDEAFDTREDAETNWQSATNLKAFNLEIGKDTVNIVRKDNSSVYLIGKVSIDRSRTISFGVSSDDGVKVWLNGKLIHSHKIGRGLNEGVDQVVGDFSAGENVLMIKVVNGVSVDGLNLRLYDANDKKIDDVVTAFRSNPANKKSQFDLKKSYLESELLGSRAIEYKRVSKARKDLEDSIPLTLVAREMPNPRPAYILKRGQYDQKGELVDRHVPPALGKIPQGARRDRLGFAHWLTAPSNPLVARVYVNRVWQQHFGTALVKTVEDFGTQGEWPNNQPLLDYLAVTFQQKGWSMKELNRTIVTSATFRQKSKISPAKLKKDPENRLISRGPRFRLDAEVIRDKALFAGGILLEKLGGRGFKPYQPQGIWEGASDPASQTHFYVRDTGKSIYRRSLYLFWKRTAPPPAMLNLDAPLRDTCVVRRSMTNTPLQALTTENETAFLESARLMANRILSVKGDDRLRMNLAFEYALLRRPRESEFEVLNRALALYRQKFSKEPQAAERLLSTGDWPQRKNQDLREQAAWMIICSTLMNTDEYLTLH